MHLFHVAVTAHQEYRKTFNPSESGPSPAQKYIKLAKVPLVAGNLTQTYEVYAERAMIIVNLIKSLKISSE
jgi:hypothetical protein